MAMNQNDLQNENNANNNANASPAQNNAAETKMKDERVNAKILAELRKQGFNINEEDIALEAAALEAVRRQMKENLASNIERTDRQDAGRETTTNAQNFTLELTLANLRKHYGKDITEETQQKLLNEILAFLKDKKYCVQNFILDTIKTGDKVIDIVELLMNRHGVAVPEAAKKELEAYINAHLKQADPDYIKNKKKPSSFNIQLIPRNTQRICLQYRGKKQDIITELSKPHYAKFYTSEILKELEEYIKSEKKPTLINIEPENLVEYDESAGFRQAYHSTYLNIKFPRDVVVTVDVEIDFPIHLEVYQLKEIQHINGQSYLEENQHAKTTDVAANGAKWYSHLNNYQWLQNLTYDYLREYKVPEVLFLWWLAATDETITTSTVENRKNAFRRAMEEAFRGHNRDNNADIDDRRLTSRTSCAIGFKNKMAECFKDILNAAHPDNVYVADLADFFRNITRNSFIEVLKKREDVKELSVIWAKMDHELSQLERGIIDTLKALTQDHVLKYLEKNNITKESTKVWNNQTVIQQVGSQLIQTQQKQDTWKQIQKWVNDNIIVLDEVPFPEESLKALEDKKNREEERIQKEALEKKKQEEEQASRSKKNLELMKILHSLIFPENLVRSFDAMTQDKVTQFASKVALQVLTLYHKDFIIQTKNKDDVALWEFQKEAFEIVHFCKNVPGFKKYIERCNTQYEYGVSSFLKNPTQDGMVFRTINNRHLFSTDEAILVNKTISEGRFAYIKEISLALEKMRNSKEADKFSDESLFKNIDFSIKTIETENKVTLEKAAERKAKEEHDKRQKEIEEIIAKAKAKQKALEEEERRKAKEEAERKAREEAERKAREEEERKAREAKEKAEQEARKKAEEEARKKEIEDARKRREAELQAKELAEVEAFIKREAEEKTRREAAEKARREAVEKQRQQDEERRKLRDAQELEQLLQHIDKFEALETKKKGEQQVQTKTNSSQEVQNKRNTNSTKSRRELEEEEFNRVLELSKVQAKVEEEARKKSEAADKLYNSVQQGSSDKYVEKKIDQDEKLAKEQRVADTRRKIAEARAALEREEANFNKALAQSSAQAGKEIKKDAEFDQTKIDSNTKEVKRNAEAQSEADKARLLRVAGRDTADISDINQAIAAAESHLSPELKLKEEQEKQRARQKRENEDISHAVKMVMVALEMEKKREIDKETKKIDEKQKEAMLKSQGSNSNSLKDNEKSSNQKNKGGMGLDDTWADASLKNKQKASSASEDLNSQFDLLLNQEASALDALQNKLNAKPSNNIEDSISSKDNESTEKKVDKEKNNTSKESKVTAELEADDQIEKVEHDPDQDWSKDNDTKKEDHWGDDDEFDNHSNEDEEQIKDKDTKTDADASNTSNQEIKVDKEKEAQKQKDKETQVKDSGLPSDPLLFSQVVEKTGKMFRFIMDHMEFEIYKKEATNDYMAKQNLTNMKPSEINSDDLKRHIDAEVRAEIRKYQNAKARGKEYPKADTQLNKMMQDAIKKIDAPLAPKKTVESGDDMEAIIAASAMGIDIGQQQAILAQIAQNKR